MKNKLYDLEGKLTFPKDFLLCGRGTAALGIFEVGLRTILGEAQIDHLYSPYVIPFLGSATLGLALTLKDEWGAKALGRITAYAWIGAIGINLLNYFCD